MKKHNLWIESPNQQSSGARAWGSEVKACTGILSQQEEEMSEGEMMTLCDDLTFGEHFSFPGDQGSIPGSGRSPGEGTGYWLQYSCLREFHRQRGLACCNPWAHKKSDMTEWQTLSLSLSVLQNNHRIGDFFFRVLNFLLLTITFLKFILIGS